MGIIQMENLEKNQLPVTLDLKKMGVDMKTKIGIQKEIKITESINNSSKTFNHIKKIETFKKVTTEQPIMGLTCIPTGNPPDRD